MNLYNTFTIADTHFSHASMARLRYEAGLLDSPDVARMDELLIEIWNRAVSKDDHVVIAGDFVWKPDCFERIFRALNGKKLLAKGNHDFRQVPGYPGWLRTGDILHLRLGARSDSPRGERLHFYVCHYPLRSWNRQFHGSFHIYGHTHRPDMRDRREFNAGCDTPFSQFAPMRMDHVAASMWRRWYPALGGEPDDSGAFLAFARDWNEWPDIGELMRESMEETGVAGIPPGRMPY